MVMLIALSLVGIVALAFTYSVIAHGVGGGAFAGY